MKNFSYILVLLADGKGLTSDQIAKQTGKANKNVSADIYSLKRRGLVEATGARPTAYVISVDGRSHLKRGQADTKTSRILDAYVCGEPLSAMEVEAITGIELDRVRNVSRRLQMQGLLAMVREDGERNVRRQLTEAGARLVKTGDVEPIAMDAETTIKSAMRTRSALDMAWGAMA